MYTFLYISIVSSLWTPIVYPFLLYSYSKLFGCKKIKNSDTKKMDLSIIITAYNEEGKIKSRIRNCLNQEYPYGNLEVIVGSDGSTDKTVEEARKCSGENVRILDFPQNRGRSQVHNDCVEVSNGDILLFTDADTKFDDGCVEALVNPFRDALVGCSGGELRSKSFESSSIGTGQSAYWRWEYQLRRLQSCLGVLTKVSGALMAMRKTVYQELPPDIDIDQAAGPLSLLQGYINTHQSRAKAREVFPSTIEDGVNTRVRLTLRGLTAISKFGTLLNPIKYPLISVNYVSYRLMRYVAPCGVILAYIASTLAFSESILSVLTTVSFSSIYFCGLIGYVTGKKYTE
jgi:glycosyltransferase involved in cell wall biosynthesis